MAEPLVSINVLSYNRRDELRKTLRKLFEQDYKNIELIVVDNNSTDGTVDMIRSEFPTVRLIPLAKNIGIAGWNYGFEIAQGEYILVLDDDCHIEGKTLYKSIECFRNSQADIVSFNVIDPLTNYSYTHYFPGGLFSFWGCAVMLSKDVLRKIGVFDKNIFLYHHESEYMIRALKNGLKHHILLSEYAFHRKDPSLRSYDNNTMQVLLFSLAYSYLKHLNGFNFLHLLINYYCEALIISMRLLRRDKLFSFEPFETVSRAAYKAIVSKKATSKTEFDESLIIDNDVYCINPLLRLFLRKISKKRERDYLIKFITKRKDYYPDFVEEYFLTMIPYRSDMAQVK